MRRHRRLSLLLRTSYLPPSTSHIPPPYRRPARVTQPPSSQAYLDLSVCIERPRFEYSPAHTYALVDMANAGKLLMPRGLFVQVASGRTGATGAGSAGGGAGVPPLAWWDTGRCMVHGKFDATVFGGTCRTRRFVLRGQVFFVGSFVPCEVCNCNYFSFAILTRHIVIRGSLASLAAYLLKQLPLTNSK